VIKWMSRRPWTGPSGQTQRFEPGEMVHVEVDGTWIDGVYEGFARGAGSVVRTNRTIVVIPCAAPRLRRR
jgi:ribosomal protein L21E